MKVLSGVIKVVGGLAIWGVAIVAEISWLAFCFGTVVIGVLLLFIAPHILLLPFTLSIPGSAMIYSGLKELKGNPYKRLKTEMADLGITRFDLILYSDVFQDNYAPEHLKLTKRFENNTEYQKFPELDDEDKYKAYLDAVILFWDEHSLNHSTTKSWHFAPKKKQ